MTTNQHTPGPWEFEKEESRYQGSVHYSIKTSYKPAAHPHSPRFIAWMCGSLGEASHNRDPKDYRDDPEIEADCRLIAAAPEMLDAIEFVEEFFAKLERDTEWGDRLQEIREKFHAPIHNKLRPLIRKARGQS